MCVCVLFSERTRRLCDGLFTDARRDAVCTVIIIIFFYCRLRDFLQGIVIPSRAVTSFQVVRKMLSLANSRFMEVKTLLTAWQWIVCNHVQVHTAIVSLRHF